MAKILLKRGPSSNLTSLILETGEPAFTTDTKKLYIGTADGGKELINPDATGKADTADRLTTPRAISLTGDLTGSADFDGGADAPIAATLADSGVTAGTHTKVTVDAKGRVTDGASLAAGDIPSLTMEKITDAGTAALCDTGRAGGQVPLLNANGKLDTDLFDDSMLGNVKFMGLWNASNNTPALPATPAASAMGHYYITTTAGTEFGIKFAVGDWIIAHDSPIKWGKVNNTDAVASVNGQTGTVTITTITGNAGTATALENPRAFSATGDLTAEAQPFDGSDNVILPMVLANSGVTAGTHTKVTVDAKGRVTAGAALAEADIPGLSADKTPDVVAKAGDTMTGKLTLPASAAAAAPLNMPHGAAPTTPANGDIWTTTASILARLNGTTRTMYHDGNMTTVTQAEAQAGTVTAVRAFTPQRVAQAIAALALTSDSVIDGGTF